MKITVLMGSPFTDGNNNKLVESFTKGAREAGHEVVRFNVALMDIEPCTKAYFDALEKGEQADTPDMQKILQSVIDSQVVVFSTPLYYYGMTSQLKAVLDHFNSKKRNPDATIQGCDFALKLRRYGSLEHERDCDSL